MTLETFAEYLRSMAGKQVHVFTVDNGRWVNHLLVAVGKDYIVLRSGEAVIAMSLRHVVHVSHATPEQ
jgi:hypothetical protein